MPTNTSVIMSQKKSIPVFIFRKRNYKILILALLMITIGFILMSGGGSEDPNVFNPDIYNFRRIRLAPTLVLLGFAVVVYAILTEEKKNK